MDKLTLTLDPSGKLSDTDSVLLRSPRMARDLEDLSDFLKSKPKYVPTNVRNRLQKVLLIHQLLEVPVGQDGSVINASERAQLAHKLSKSIVDMLYIPVETICELEGEVNAVREAVESYTQLNTKFRASALGQKLSDALKSITLENGKENAFAMVLSLGGGKVPDELLNELTSAGALLAIPSIKNCKIDVVVTAERKPKVEAAIASNKMLTALAEDGAINYRGPVPSDFCTGGDDGNCFYAGWRNALSASAGTVGAFF